MTDYRPDPDLDRVAEVAYGITERLREDPTRLYGELAALWCQHPCKAAQVTMTLAAWLDPETPCSVLWERVENAAKGVA